MPYARAHWFLLIALAVIVVGFWPTFFRSPGLNDSAHMLHGVTATLWVVILVVQSLLISRRRRTWHRRVAKGALLLLPVLVVSGLYMIKVMFANQLMPEFMLPLLAYINFTALFLLLLLVGLGLSSVRRPAAHVRFMTATVLLALPPALTRLYARELAPTIDFPTALHLGFITDEIVCLLLILADRRIGERHLAWPLSLLFTGAVHASMFEVSASDAWSAFTRWYVNLPIWL